MASVVLVEGAWSTAKVFDRLIVELRRRGIDTTAPGLLNPNTGARMPMRSPHGLDRIRRAIDAAAGPVVLAGHSAGGHDITAVGGHPKVAHLVYMSAFVPGSGVELPEQRSRIRNSFDFDGEFLRYKRDEAKVKFFGDLSADELRVALTHLVPQEPFGDLPEPEDPSWRQRPSTFVVFDADTAITRDEQLAWAAQLDEIVHIEGAAHFGFISQPGAVADVLERICRSIPSPSAGEQS